MVQAALLENALATSTGTDSGSAPTIAGRNWLEAQSFRCTERQMDRLLHLTGLEAKPMATENNVNLDMLLAGYRVSDGSPAKLYLWKLTSFITLRQIIDLWRHSRKLWRGPELWEASNGKTWLRLQDTYQDF